MSTCTSRIFMGSMVRGLASRTTKSASFPTVIEPRIFSSKCCQAGQMVSARADHVGDMAVAIDEAGDHDLTAKVDDLSCRRPQPLDLTVVPDGHDPAGLDGAGLGAGPVAVHRHHVTI